MEETRTEKISVNLTPSVKARLDAYRKAHRWPRSTAASVLIELGLDLTERQAQLSARTPARLDIDELVRQFPDQEEDR